MAIFQSCVSSRRITFLQKAYCLLLCLFAFPFSVIKADHVSGLSVTYKCLGGNNYEFSVEFYRDCAGIGCNIAGFVCKWDLAFSSSCGNFIRTLDQPQVQAGYPKEVTPLCPGTTSTCSGGSVAGITRYLFKTNITFPAQCKDWTVILTSSKNYGQPRSVSVVNLTGIGNLNNAVRFSMDNTICNNSPVFANDPRLFYCVGKPYCIDYGVSDPDGDSLVFSLINPLNNSSSVSPPNPGNATYAAGYSPLQFVKSNPPVTLNTSTGQICFTPTNVESVTYALLIEEYRNGVKIGSISREQQIFITSCTNNPPDVKGIDGTTNYSATVCAGNQLCFDVPVKDADASQQLTVSWNNAINGATFTVSGTPPTGRFCWTPSASEKRNNPYVFTVSAKDNACPFNAFSEKSFSITVSSCNPPSPVVTVNSPSVCPGGCASLTATPSGGTSPYTYSWTPNIGVGAGPHNVCPVSATTYTVTITDNGGLSSTATSQATVRTPPSATITSTNSSCSGLSNGSATASGSSGVSPYTYSWSGGGGNTAAVGNLSSGTYTVTVTDNAGCSSTSSVVITAPAPVNMVTSSAPSNCGQSNGNATVSGNGGVSPYTYSWSGGAGNTSVAGNLSSGTYFVTVTDKNGCSKTTSVSVGSLGSTTASITSSVNTSCYNISNGSATASGGGGTSPYTFSWSGGGGTTSAAGNLLSGTYTVTVTDATGCPATATVVITAPPSINLGTSRSNSVCISSNGSATVTASGGSGAFTYQWTGGPSSNIYSNVLAGTYTVRVTDWNGCTKDTTVVVGNTTTSITLATTKTDANCGGSDGSATVTISSGGTSPFTYLWSGVSGSTSQVTGLSQGTYSVTVTDANGCTNSSIVSVSDIGSPSLNVNGVNVKCNGQNSGSITSTVTGGVLPYTYLWSSGQTTPNISNVSAGTYTLTVRGQNGCSVQQVVTLTEPSALSLTTGKIDANCGQADGSASVNASGGTGTYSYSWSGVSGSMFQVTGLLAGTYTVTVTDGNGCTATAVESVADVGAPGVTAVKTDNLCYGGNNGTASATPAGGILPYTYQWSGGSGSTQPAVSNLSAGTYTITITGNNGCKVTTTVTITQPGDINLAISSTDELCGSGNGTATVMATGGSGTFSYMWTGGSGSTQPAVGNLNAGNYSVTVTDANGCSKIISTSISNIADYGPKAYFTMNPTITEILAPQIKFYDQSGGVARWDWDFGDGVGDSIQNPQHTYTDTGTYQACLSITNQYGCSSSYCQPVTIKPIWAIYIPNAFTPDGDGRNEIFLPQGMGIQTYELYIFDRWGDLQFKSTEVTRGWDGRANNGAGTVEEDVYVYMVKVTDVNNKQHRYTGRVSVIK